MQHFLVPMFVSNYMVHIKHQGDTNLGEMGVTVSLHGFDFWIKSQDQSQRLPQSDRGLPRG